MPVWPSTLLLGARPCHRKSALLLKKSAEFRNLPEFCRNCDSVGLPLHYAKFDAFVAFRTSTVPQTWFVFFWTISEPACFRKHRFFFLTISAPAWWNFHHGNCEMTDHRSWIKICLFRIVQMNQQIAAMNLAIMCFLAECNISWKYFSPSRLLLKFWRRLRQYRLCLRSKLHRYSKETRS